MFSQLRGNSNVEEKLPRYENSTPAELRNRTEKGRTQFLLNKQKARLAAEQPRPANEESKCAQLQKFFFTSKFFKAQLEEGVYASDGVSDYKSFGLDRARSVYSLARCLAEVISKFFTAENPETRLFHAINTHVVDDTSTRLKGPTHADRATVFTIMNTVQCLHARYTPINVLAAQGNTGKVEEADGCKSLRVPTPLQLVTNADATGIHRGFCRFCRADSPRYGQDAPKVWGAKRSYSPSSLEDICLRGWCFESKWGGLSGWMLGTFSEQQGKTTCHTISLRNSSDLSHSKASSPVSSKTMEYGCPALSPVWNYVIPQISGESLDQLCFKKLCVPASDKASRRILPMAENPPEIEGLCSMFIQAVEENLSCLLGFSQRWLVFWLCIPLLHSKARREAMLQWVCWFPDEMLEVDHSLSVKRIPGPSSVPL